MDGLPLLRKILDELRALQFDALERSHRETDAGYRNGHNDGVRLAIKACEQHLGFEYECSAKCGWLARCSQGISTLAKHIRCPNCNKPIQLMEVVL